ncbi:hypothetical protein VTG60DRAFT_5614 [Thermothelomyces hinnuleus]
MLCLVPHSQDSVAACRAREALDKGKDGSPVFFLPPRSLLCACTPHRTRNCRLWATRIPAARWPSQIRPGHRSQPRLDYYHTFFLEGNNALLSLPDPTRPA